MLIAVLLAAAGAAQARTLRFQAVLTGAGEEPAVATSAHGRADATLDTRSRRLVYRVIYDGLSGPLVGAHFHDPADPGYDDGPLVIMGTGASPIRGSARLSPSQADDLIAGRWYANLHTPNHPNGEIRGRVLRRR